MVRRTLKRKPSTQPVVHNLVALHKGELLARCGATERKPDKGTGSMAAFGFNCPDCAARTRQIKEGVAT